MKRRITDDMFARIPALLLEGMTKAEIAAMYGVTPGTLAVQCCRRGISLRKGGPWPKRTKLGLQLPLSDSVLKSLREAARAMGKDTARLASDLLEKIVSDNLYKAVLDEEAHRAPSTIRPTAAASSAINHTLAVREPAH
jgi:hypothetical protein